MSEITTNEIVPAVKATQVHKAFGNLHVLKGIDMTVMPGTVTVILGPSGSGKSTFLRLINQLETLTGGEIDVDGEMIGYKYVDKGGERVLQTLNDKEVAEQRSKLGMVFQRFNLFPHMTALENVMEAPVHVKHMDKKEARELAIQELNRVGMGERLDYYPAQLSGGQQQRVAIARAVVNKPLVLLLDEPFSALDYKLRRAMQLEIKRLQRRLGITFVFVTHDQEEAFAMSDRVVVMNQGRIEQIGTPQEIYEEPSNLYVARFVGEINILPARIMSVPGEGIYIADISGRRFTLRTSRPFAAGDRVNVLLRPEDIRVYAHDDERPEGPYLTGRIEETVYKGATVDISIALDSGETLSVAEFFNEDDAEISYNRGERVAVTWVDGWEVVLPYEAD